MAQRKQAPKETDKSSVRDALLEMFIGGPLEKASGFLVDSLVPEGADFGYLVEIVKPDGTSAIVACIPSGCREHLHAGRPLAVRVWSAATGDLVVSTDMPEDLASCDPLNLALQLLHGRFAEGAHELRQVVGDDELSGVEDVT